MSLSDVTSIISVLVNLFYRPVADRVSLVRSLRAKGEELDREVRSLRAKKNDIVAAVDRNCGGDRSHRVDDWLNQVDEFLASSEDFKRSYAERPSSCNCLCRCGALENYKLAKNAKELLQRASRLKTKGDEFLRIIDPHHQGAPARVKDIPIYGPIVGQEEEFQTVLKLIEKDDDSIGVVGIWGMGGIGKTTLLRSINNHFCNNSTTSGFDVVIFTAGRRNSSSSILEMQQDIGNRLGIFQSKTASEMLGMSHLETGDERKNAEQIFNSLRSKSFLLLLDDLWEVTELERLGIPPLNSSSMEGRELLQQQKKKKRKVVLTTRNRGICCEMGSTGKGVVAMGLLSNEMSWELFCKHVNNKQLLERNAEVAFLAKEVADKCDHLPLALVTVGKAMSKYEEACQWRNAKQELQRSEFQPMKEKVLSQLKFSFDRLESDYMRHILFVFTSDPPSSIYHKISYANLFALTNDYSGSDWKSAVDNALTRITDVVNSGLLMYTGATKDYVKLHDCVYDMLCSLAETETDKYGNIMLRWSPPHSRENIKDCLSKFIRRWECAQNISMFECDLTEIPSDVEMPNCSVLRRLYWPRGKLLRFPEHFFDRMTCLRALDLRGSDIEELPRSFGYQQPVNLKHLNLSWSRIRKLPEGMGNLRQLVSLNLDFTGQLEDIPKCFLRLESLEEFSILGSAFRWTWDDNDGSGRGRDNNDGIDMNRRRRQATLQKLVEMRFLRETKISLQVDVAIMSGLMLCSEGLLHSIRWLHMNFGVFKGCMDFEELFKIFARLEHVETIDLLNIPLTKELRLIREDDFQACDSSSPLFPSLKEMSISNWFDLCDLAWINRIPRLQEVWVSNCANLSVLFSESSKEDFPHLKSVKIQGCPKLNSIARNCTSLLLPSLETVAIKRCPQLKSLPFSDQSANKIKRIEASKEWWNALEWENDNVKSKFLPHFIATDTESDGEYGNITLRWSPPDSREQQLQDYPLNKFFARWEYAQDISMEGCDLTEIPSDVKMPNCSVLRILYWPDGKILHFPEHFFDRMSCLRALDLRGSHIEELPRSFGYQQLVNLKHLNLSHSRIRKLPEGVGNLRQLVSLDLKFTEQLEDIPCRCFLRLESLKEFRIGKSAFRWTWDDNDGSGGDSVNNDGNDRNGRRRQATLQNLLELRSLRETGISLQVDPDIMSGLMLCSQGLLHSILFLEMDFSVFKGRMDFDKLFKIFARLGNIERIGLFNIPPTEDDFQTCRGPSPLFPNLTYMGIHNWFDLCDLAWINRIPRLQQVYVSNCANLSVLFSESSKEGFPHLKSLRIEDCPKLNSIARNCTSLLLPSLETVVIKGCPQLKSLSFNEQSANKIKRIETSEEWWNALEWENDNVKSKFLPHFIATVDF